MNIIFIQHVGQNAGIQLLAPEITPRGFFVSQQLFQQIGCCQSVLVTGNRLEYGPATGRQGTACYLPSQTAPPPCGSPSHSGPFATGKLWLPSAAVPIPRHFGQKCHQAILAGKLHAKLNTLAVHATSSSRRVLARGSCRRGVKGSTFSACPRRRIRIITERPVMVDGRVPRPPKAMAE